MTIRIQHDSLQMLLCFALIKQIVITEAIVFSSTNNIGKPWTFQEGANVTLICTIDPYTTIQAWKFNDTVVADCALSLCNTYNNANGVFTFTHFINATFGKFYWTINPMKMDFNNNKFTCNDGSLVENYQTITVLKDQNSDNKITSSNNKPIGIGVGIGVGVGVPVIVCIVCIGVLVYKLAKAKAPAIPSKFTGERQSTSKIRLYWIRGDNGGLPQTFIITNIRTQKTKTVRDSFCNRHKQITCQFKEENQECQHFSLFAKHRKGKSESAHLNLPGKPYAPKNLESVKKFNQPVLLQWAASMCSQCDGNTSFNITVEEKNCPKQVNGSTLNGAQTEPITKIQTSLRNVNKYREPFENLRSDTEYTATLYSFNKMGTSKIISHSFWAVDLPEVFLDLIPEGKTIKVVLKKEIICNNVVTKMYMKTDGSVINEGQSVDYTDNDTETDKQLTEHITGFGLTQWIKDPDTVRRKIIGPITELSVNMSSSSKTKFTLIVYCETNNKTRLVANSDVRTFEIKNGIKGKSLKNISIPFKKNAD